MSQTAIQSTTAAQALALAQYGQQTQAASSQESGFSAMLSAAMTDSSSAAGGAETASSIISMLIPMMLSSTMYSDSSSMSSMLPLLMMVLLLGQYQNKGTSKSNLNSLLETQREEQAAILGEGILGSDSAAATALEDCTITGG